MSAEILYNSTLSEPSFRRHEAPCPLYASAVSAGFPSPVEETIQKNIDLNEELILNPVSTFFIRVKGDAMKDAGIHNNDVLIVDRSMVARNNDIVIAVLNAELRVKRFQKLSPTKIALHSGPLPCPPIIVTTDMDFAIWGVVTTVIHSFRPSKAAEAPPPCLPSLTVTTSLFPASGFLTLL